MSKRNEPDDPTASPSTETGKKPRLDIQEQIKRASILAAQLRDGVKDGTDSKTSTANQIATEELMRIFENMQEKTARYVPLYYSSYPPHPKCNFSTSESVDGLISAHIKFEVDKTMGRLCCRITQQTASDVVQINKILKPDDTTYRKHIAQRVQEKMENVTSGDYVAMIKTILKSVLVEEYKEGSGAELASKLDGMR
jgi:hypothetical protein